MPVGKLVVGEAEAARRLAVVEQAQKKGVVGSLVRDGVKPKAGAEVAPAVEPPPKVVEFYSISDAISQAKESPFALPRLLDVELARPDGARKTVLKAYRKLVVESPEGVDVGTLVAAIDIALGDVPAVEPEVPAEPADS